VKALLLVGYLDGIAERDLPLTASHRAFLGAMIRRSDNASADVIYGHVGDAALYRLAAQAEMMTFESTATGRVHGSPRPTKCGFSPGSPR
jgi:hypothetical protein